MKGKRFKNMLIEGCNNRPIVAVASLCFVIDMFFM